MDGRFVLFRPGGVKEGKKLMTLQECYLELGGDYAAVQQRLPTQSLIKRFITKFLDDGSYAQLCGAMQAGSREEAFRAAHTLKGVCANLGFDRLCGSASRLTELLRPEQSAIPADAQPMFMEVARDYDVTVNAIRKFLSEQ